MATGKVLIIDDEIEVCDFLCDYLQEKGFSTQYFLDAKKAIDSLTRENMPDAILLDLVMPDFDGINFLDHIKKQFTQDEIPPIIIITGIDSDLLKDKALDYGALYVMVKPLDLPLLETKIKEFIKERRRSKKGG